MAEFVASRKPLLCCIQNADVQNGTALSMICPARCAGADATAAEAPT